MIILGISAYYHDSSAAIIVDGIVKAGALEERFSRVKHDNSFPILATKFCLDYAGINIDDVDLIAYYEKPFTKFERILENAIEQWPKGRRMFVRHLPIWLKEKLNMKGLIRKEMKRHFGTCRADVRFVPHHLAHAACSYYLSPFDEAAVLVVDAVGEKSTTSIFKVAGNDFTLIQQQEFPHSLGLLYSSFTYFLGFQVNSDEYKVMGLAPYGEAKNEETQRFIRIILDELVKLHDDGAIELNKRLFTFMYDDRMIDAQRWEQLFGLPIRQKDDPTTQSHMNLAFAIQHVTEMAMLRLAQTSLDLTGSSNLCLAGGCALNCVANGQLAAQLPTKVYVPYAPDDSGCSIGAALTCAYIGADAGAKVCDTPYLGPEYTEREISAAVKSNGLSAHRLGDVELYETIAQHLADGQTVGWFQGRMEFGPRALGNRSILADPRRKEMKRIVNEQIKFREEFRPFAPAVLAEHADELFEMRDATMARHMTQTYNVRSTVCPAVTHVDNTARVQAVHKEDNARFHALLSAFHRLTGCPTLLNTSFNVMGEAIVCTPNDAIRTFLHSGLDVLVLGQHIITKSPTL